MPAMRAQALCRALDWAHTCQVYIGLGISLEILCSSSPQPSVRVVALFGAHYSSGELHWR